MPDAISISRPVMQRLQASEFAGRVLSVHRAVCNLIDDERHVITLLAPPLSEGPFTVVIQVPFTRLSIGNPAYANKSQLTIGELTVRLDGARVWEPRPDWPRLRKAKERIGSGFAAFDTWASLAGWPGLAGITGADQYASDEAAFEAHLARCKEAHSRLIVEGLAERKRDSLLDGARLLAGLGPGGTPAGDDFLVGMMAAIWLLGDQTDAPLIAATAAPRTAALSAAFLRAAGHGELIEPWHRLVEALAAGDPAQVIPAARRVESFGASSGADALEGFIAAGRCLLAQNASHQRWEEPI